MKLHKYRCTCLVLSQVKVGIRVRPFCMILETPQMYENTAMEGPTFSGIWAVTS